VKVNVFFSSDTKSQKQAIAKLTREETLSKLRLELWNKKVTTIGQLRGNRRLLIVAGTRDHVLQTFSQANELKQALVERGVLIVPFLNDGGQVTAAECLSAGLPPKEVEEEEKETFANDLDKRFVAFPLYSNEWAKYVSWNLE
jgi:hypothetical protein